MRLQGVTAVAAFAVCFAVAASSIAAASVDTVGAIKYIRHGFQTKPGQDYLTVKAMCPRGTHVTGGGESNDAGFSDLTIVHTYPRDGRDRGSAPDDGWAVLLNNRDARRHSGKVSAICTERRVRYRTLNFQVPPGAQNEYNVPCPAGTRVLSGGTRGPRTVVENSVFPGTDVEWGAYLENHSGTDKSFKETAVCARIATTVQVSSLEPIDPLSKESRSAACPGAQHVYGGGQDNGAGFGGLYAGAMAPAGADHDAWRVTIDNFSVSITFNFKAYAVCGPSH